MSPERTLFRNTSTPAERPMDSRTLDAEKAKPAILRAMQEGGICSAEAEGRRRELVHDPAVDAPLKGWPWPFPLLSPHRVRLITYEGTLRSGSVTYEKNRIEEAVNYFLAGLPARAKVIISRDRGWRP